MIPEELKKLLEGLDSTDKIYSFFKEMGYSESNKCIKYFDKGHKPRISLAKDEQEKIESVHPIFSFGKNNGAFKADINVYFIKTKSTTPSLLRALNKFFANDTRQFLLIVTHDFKQITFVLPDVASSEEGKAKLTKLTIDRKDIYHTDVEVLSGLAYEGQETWRELWRQWKENFKLEKVTEKFFNDYKDIFLDLRKTVLSQKIQTKEAHEFSLQLLNRVMFIYFISRKKWLGTNPKFMKWLWHEKYLHIRSLNLSIKDSFYDVWLKTIFFEAFNNQYNGNKALPQDVSQILDHAPYLNGGLFKKNNLDKLPIKISDDLFRRIFDFYEKYNFTIKEDLPLEVEVAVDPQMIGYVYESLANVADQIYDRNELGIFYTPKVEVEFMCRRSLVEYLAKNLPEIQKEHYYHLLFDEDKEKIEKTLTKLDTWRKLEEKLENLAVVDPACGSGAFLVGMLNVLTELYRMVYKNLGRRMQDYQIKKRIISKSLYGVDVMPWAIHAAELRLWLQLIVETDYSLEQLRKEPLLPNLDMNLRIGDSLVQEIGGISFHVRANNLKSFLKSKLEALKQEKEKYANNDSTCKFKTPPEIFDEEVHLFNEIIEDRIISLKTEITNLPEWIKRKQISLVGSEPKGQIILEKEKPVREKIAAKEAEILQLQQMKKELSKPEKKPFVWELDFAEIFSSDKQGFDIVIGNPPYVRQETISPPNKLKDEVGLEERNAYKQKLIESVKKRFPYTSAPAARSDLYIYFYFHGLSLLNAKGTFSFITSNSWLDVGYGAELQEFLLKHASITAIYDNQAKRSFEHADVNTVIAIFGVPQEGAGLTLENFNKETARWPGLQNTARFVMFKQPFEAVLTTNILLEIEKTQEILKKPGFRCYPIKQEALMEDSWEYPETYDAKKEPKFFRGFYSGNKWGGKYLRAPDIYFTIVEKGRGKLVKLGDIADIRFGIKTGVNDFFYLEPTGKHSSKGCLHVKNGTGWEGEIEEEFLKPVIKSPKECDSILVKPKNLKYRIFICNKLKSELNGSNALEYIEWGEKQKTVEGVRWNKVPSVSGRKNWYDLGVRTYCEVVFPCSFGDTYIVFQNKNVLVDKRLYECYVKDLDSFIQIANSTLYSFMQEINSRVGLGDGLLDLTVYEVQKTQVLNPSFLKKRPLSINREFMNIFSECGISLEKPIHDQEPKPIPDRKELDDLVFDALGLTKEDRKEVYWAVCELVKTRLDKSKSLDGD